MDFITYAEALLLINKKHRNNEITDQESNQLRNFCLELHNIWKEKVNK